MTEALVIEAVREAYSIDQVRGTMTVGELKRFLEYYDDETPVYLGHDRQNYGFYTYGGITKRMMELVDVDEDEDE